MRFNYCVYPTAIEKINSTKLQKEIEMANEKYTIPIIGSTSAEDIVSITNEMKKEGYLKTLPQEYSKLFKKGLNNAFGNIKNFPWRIYRDEKSIESPLLLDDFYLLTGWMASFVLKPNEIWDYKKFGFSSIDDFVGSVGAYIWQTAHRNITKGGYTWETKAPNGRIFKSNVSGDTNLDLRIYRTDITPDKTINPLGNEVSYRPTIEEDRQWVAAYHSTELPLMVGLLKYVDQQKIPSEMLENNGKPLIEWTKSLGHHIGAATECFETSFNHSFELMMPLKFFNEPLPVLDSNYSTDKQTFDGLHTADAEGHYEIFVGPNKEFILSYEKTKNIESKKNIAVCFQPEEIDHLLKGVCYQSAMGLGRTAPQKIIKLLEYRFSEQMEKDLKEFST